MNSLRPVNVLFLAMALFLLSHCAQKRGVSDTDRRVELFAAARSGDLKTAQRLIAEGVPVDSQDKYGSTALIMAAGAGHVEIIRLLLDHGADVDHAESFYGANALGQALFSDHREALPLLLAAGADQRELVLGVAVGEQDFDLIRSVLASGPIYVSMLDELSAREPGDERLAALLQQAQRRPDPPPPTLRPEELQKYVGTFEGQETDTAIDVGITGGRLDVTLNGERIAVEIVGEDRFRSTDGTTELAFFGRAGSIEGIQWSQTGRPPESLRHSVAEPVGGAGFSGVAAPASPSAVTTVHWPSFRGNAGNGNGDGAEVPLELDAESPRWSVPVEGLGNSSPVVWGDRLFLTTAVAAGVSQELRTGLTGDGGQVDEQVQHVWKVLAFDKWTGASLWSTEIGRGIPLTRRHFKSSQANSTPATDGKHLVVTFPTIGMAGLDLDGNVLWKTPLGALNAGAFTDPGMEWGFASSPTLYDDRVVLQVDVHGGQYLAAWRLTDGTELWRTQRDVAPSWATPAVLRSSAGDELVVNGSTIQGYDPQTGDELWSLGPNSELVIATPVVVDNLIYVSAGYPPVKPIYAIRAGMRGTFEVVPGTEHEALAWSHNRGGAYMPSPLHYRGLLYVVHHNGRLVAYDAATGTAIFKSRFSAGGTFTASPVAANGRIYLPTEEGQVYVIQAGPEYAELAVSEIDEPLMATPAISEGLLFLRTPTRLIAFGDAREH